MKKLIIILLLIIPLNVNALTKDDIISYVSSYEDKICDSYTLNLYQNYKVLYQRMLSERDLTDDELNDLYNKLSSAINLIINNDICKKDDLNTIDSNIKKEIKNLLYEGEMIIYNAKDIDENSSTSFSIDSDNNILTIYKNGYVYDEVKIGNSSLNEVGPSKIIMIILITNLVIITGSILLIRKYKNNYFIKALLIQNILIFILVICNANILNKGIFILNTLKDTSNGNTQDIIVSNNKIITYPSIGNNYGTLEINDLGISLPIYFGDNSKILNKGIGHTSSSYFPGEGGTIIYSTHNIYLKNINKLKDNSNIIIKTSYGTFTYKVNKKEIINKDYLIKISDNKEELILYTCYPISDTIYGNKRYMITSTLVDSRWS